MQGIIGHHIGGSWEEEGHVAVAVLALMGAGKVAEKGGRSVTGHGSFVHAGDCWSVVGAIGDCGIGNIMGGHHQGDLAEEASMFQVTVGDGALWVVFGH